MEELIQSLKNQPKIPFWGTSMSSFQSDPASFELTDWGHQVNENLHGRPSAIAPPQNQKELPHFLKNPQSYIDRGRQMHQNMFRFSLDGLCPRSGCFDARLMSQYVKILARCKESGQEPLVTIQHFTMPRYLMKRTEGRIHAGAWENPSILEHFYFYVKKVREFLSNKTLLQHIFIEMGLRQHMQEYLLEEGLVKYFMSINEPAMTPMHGYLTGVFPPQRKGNIIKAYKVLNTMIKAHDIMYTELKEIDHDNTPQIGIGYNWQCNEGFVGSLIHHMDKWYTDKFERDGEYSDFLGLQYYFRQSIPPFKKRIEGWEYGDHPGFGDMYPAGILTVLQQMHRRYPSKDIFITEMGFADGSDKRRPLWLLETIQYILKAKQAGIPVKSILLWSLVDNLEWEQGMNVRFGLFSEKELGEPMVSSLDTSIRTWEVWRALMNARKNPNSSNLEKLHQCYIRAEAQHHVACKK